jgi:hypothetical protein
MLRKWREKKIFSIKPSFIVTKHYFMKNAIYWNCWKWFSGEWVSEWSLWNLLASGAKDEWKNEKWKSTLKLGGPQKPHRWFSNQLSQPLGLDVLFGWVQWCMSDNRGRYTLPRYAGHSRSDWAPRALRNDIGAEGAFAKEVITQPDNGQTSDSEAAPLWCWSLFLFLLARGRPGRWSAIVRTLTVLKPPVFNYAVN